MRKSLKESCDIYYYYLAKDLGIDRLTAFASLFGVGGGFLLAKDPSEITMLDILEAEEGKLKLNHCLVDADFCQRDAYCSAHEVWHDAQREMAEVLRHYSIADLVRREKENIQLLKKQIV